MCNRELLNLLSEYQNRDMRHFELLYEVFYKLILSYSKRVGEKESQQDLSDFLVELLFKIDLSKFAADDSE